jgi:riboflavin kinase/FMN adenylyltransferase
VEVIEHLSAAQAAIGGRPAAVTFGAFDGLHLGHQDLIHRVVECSRRNGGAAVALTFAEHPLKLLAPAYAPPLLLSQTQKIEVLAALGVDVTVVVEFDRAFADQSPETFVEDVLLGALRARAIFLGFNNRFGKGGAGDATLVQQIGRERGVEVEVVPPRLLGESVVSSTQIRGVLREGQVRRAATLLGRPYRIEGEVVAGLGRGRVLGFPTANLAVPPDRLLPGSGVYAVHVHHAGRIWAGMMNIGHRPTFEPGRLSVEVHMIDFEGDLYGERLDVDFVERLRTEQRFASIDALRSQLELDRQVTRSILESEQ